MSRQVSIRIFILTQRGFQINSAGGTGRLHASPGRPFSLGDMRRGVNTTQFHGDLMAFVSYCIIYYVYPNTPCMLYMLISWGGFGGQCRHIWHTSSVWDMGSHDVCILYLRSIGLPVLQKHRFLSDVFGRTSSNLSSSSHVAGKPDICSQGSRFEKRLGNRHPKSTHPGPQNQPEVVAMILQDAFESDENTRHFKDFRHGVPRAGGVPGICW